MCLTLSRTRSSRRLIGGGCTLVMCGRVNSTVRWGFEPAGTWFVPVESNPSKRCGDQLVQTTLRFFPTERRRAHRRFFQQLSRRPHNREEVWPAPCQVQQTHHWRWLGILWQTAASTGIVSVRVLLFLHHSTIPEQAPPAADPEAKRFGDSRCRPGALLSLEKHKGKPGKACSWLCVARAHRSQRLSCSGVTPCCQKSRSKRCVECGHDDHRRSPGWHGTRCSRLPSARAAAETSPPACDPSSPPAADH